MKNQWKDMTSGRPVSLILSFALPLMIGNVFQQLYTVVDTAVVGKALGVDALAALGAVDWLNWMVLGLIQGMTQGFGIRMAQEFGARQEEPLRATVGAATVIALVGSVVLALLSQALAKPALQLLQTPQTIIDDSLIYLRIVFMGLPVVMAYNLQASILRSLGDGQTPLRAMIVASGVNIGLDLLFVLVFHWGIAGAALATVIAQGCSGIFCYMQIRKIEMLKLKREHFLSWKQLSLPLIRLGLPMAAQNVIIAVGGMILQTVVNGFGVTFIAGYTATNKLYGILEMAATSYGYAMVTYVGQNLGAGKVSRIRSGLRAAVGVSLVTSVVIAGMMIGLGKWILSAFISGTPEEFEHTMEVAYHYLVVMSVCLPVLYILHVTRSSVQGMGNTVLPMVSGIAEFVVRTGAAMVLPVFFGGAGVFYAEVLAWLGADLVLIPSYLATVKKCEDQLNGKESG